MNSSTEREGSWLFVPGRDRFEISTEPALRVISVSDEPEPGPRQWVIRHWIPEEAITLLYGDVDTYKTYLALSLAICVSANREWAGLPIEKQQPVLFVDAEGLGRDEFIRRAYWVARGLGLTTLPSHLYYLDLPYSLANERIIERVRLHGEERDCGLIVLDSLSVAAAGLDLKEPAPMTLLLQRLRSWGTVLAVDHVAKQQAPKPDAQAKDRQKAPSTSVSPFGSQFKRALMRSGIRVTREKDIVTLKVDKSNFAEKTESRKITVEFTGNAVVFSKPNKATTDHRGATPGGRRETEPTTRTARLKLLYQQEARAEPRTKRYLMDVYASRWQDKPLTEAAFKTYTRQLRGKKEVRLIRGTRPPAYLYAGPDDTS